jgi:hypothetical protein
MKKDAGVEWIVNNLYFLMVVCELNIVSIAIFKLKADAPLVINSNTMLAFTILMKFFKLVGALRKP